MGIFVRPAMVEDIPFITGELPKFDSVYDMKLSLMPEPEYARQRLSLIIEDATNFLFLVAERREPGQVWPVGFILSILYDHFYNPKVKVCSELLWWVRAEDRGTMVGATLLDTWTAHARARADCVILNLNERTPINPHTLERRGFRLMERAYLMEVR